MGFFDFMKSAGDNKITETVEVSQDRLNVLRQQNINKNIAQLQGAGANVAVQVAGEIATLTGTVPSREALEKVVLCAGNQHGIGKVDCQIEVKATPAVVAAGQPPQSPPQAESSFYTVKPGDTLGKIALAAYGSAGKYPVIFEANKPMLSDPDKIYPGQSLRIPPL
ncbi:MAG: peptidoglycan-binding protein LysM [Haliea sp.]|jgi:nucleoid-associated protein YgaU|nr:peptidoglycan-binding protein LysM [Haliea sp.]MBK6739242.1 peptidoglycan-binding protein LysM [Haliea sp.]